MTGPRAHRRVQDPEDPPTVSDQNDVAEGAPAESWRVSAGYWKVRAMRAQAESEIHGRELKRFRQWMDELQEEVEALRRNQQRAEETFYEQLLDRQPDRRRMATVTTLGPASGPELAGQLESQGSQIATLELELDAERARSNDLEADLAARRATDEALAESARKLDSMLSDQEKHMESLEAKLSKVDGKLLSFEDAQRSGSARKPALLDEPVAERAPRREKAWRRIQSMFSATEG